MRFDRLARNWENLARQDPMWAILSDATRKGGKWDAAEFFATGREFVAWLGSWLGLHRIEVPRTRALDFGCGLGRLTQALAPHFEHVVGIDVSATMVDGAVGHNRFGAKVDYVHNVRPDLSVIASDSIDFVLSVIVLQHMRPEYAAGYMREFVRVLRPGGKAFFQMPVAANAGANANAGECEPESEAYMEMHCLDKAQVHEAVAAAGGRVMVCEDDQWAMPGWTSAHYLVAKDAAPA